jgi:hypothetical protein
VAAPGAARVGTRTAPLLAALLLALSAVACGGGGRSGAGTTTTPSAVGPVTTSAGGVDQPAPTSPDQARSQAIVLTAGDLGPDFQSTAHDTSSGTKAFTDCGAGNSILVDDTYPTEADSDDYERVAPGQTIDVTSSARVAPDVGTAQQAAAVVAAPRFPGCLADSLKATLASAGSVGAVRPSTLRVPRRGDDAVGVRATVTVKAGDVTQDISLDLVFLRKDRALAYVAVTTISGTPDDGLRDRLALAMAGRM